MLAVISKHCSMDDEAISIENQYISLYIQILIREGHYSLHTVNYD